MKVIEGYDGRYKIDEDGNVFSMVLRGKGVQAAPVTKLKHSDNRGYKRVSLRIDSNSPVKGKYVHRLVAEAYIPNPGKLSEVNHIDGDKSNNSVTNLEWCDRQTNIDHAWATGLSTNGMNIGKGQTTYIGTNVVTGDQIVCVGKEELKRAGFTHSGIVRAINGERGPIHKGHTWKKIKSSEK